LFVFRILEISSRTPDAAPVSLPFEAQHTMHFMDTWHPCCLAHDSYANCIQQYEPKPWLKGQGALRLRAKQLPGVMKATGIARDHHNNRVSLIAVS
jgi:hypothetical protein